MAIQEFSFETPVLLASLAAWKFGDHPMLLITPLTLRRVDLLILPFRFITFETVAVETPALAAISRIVNRTIR